MDIAGEGLQKIELTAALPAHLLHQKKRKKKIDTETVLGTEWTKQSCRSAVIMQTGRVFTEIQPWGTTEKTLEITIKSLAGFNLKAIFPDLQHSK